MSARYSDKALRAKVLRLDAELATLKVAHDHTRAQLARVTAERDEAAAAACNLNETASMYHARAVAAERSLAKTLAECDKMTGEDWGAFGATFSVDQVLARIRAAAAQGGE